ncbi:MAG TPA: aminopeptidase, partial [Acidobacteriaceae bacterium]
MSAAAVPVAESHGTHEARLDRLASVAIEVGLGLARGQELLITASLETLPLVRRITEHAYRAGASLVTTFYSDDEATLARFRYAPDESFDTVATWLQDGVAQAFRSNAARMAIAGGNPALLAKEDPEKVGRANRAFSKASRPAMELITRHAINWTIVAAATPAWAATVFPGKPEDEAVAKLWDAIFAASRVDAPDPVAAWREHDDGLRRRAAKLNERRYSTLHFRGPGTDLRVGL